LGPCFYPAGHIWHYIPAYWLHLQTENAEYIVKFGHLVIHSLINVFVAKIAYVYFGDQKHNAQLIALSMLANKESRGYYASMYNDEIMMLYLLIAIYY
jgi:hypothetical protein